MAAREATSWDGLRESDRLSALVREWDDGERTYFAVAEDMADVLRDWLPALRDVLAAAARDAEKVRRVEALAESFLEDADECPADDRTPGWLDSSDRIRRALDAP